MMRYQRLSLLLVVVVVAGCGGKKNLTAHDRQMQAMDRTKEAQKTYFTYMVDNAIMHDMSIADIHFIPHSDELSGTGVFRLDRMAPLLNTYGGIVRYETTETDQERIKARISYVEEYLSVVGCDMENIEVKIMLSGGRGMPAVKAIKGLEETEEAIAPGDTNKNIASLTGASNN